MVYAAISSDELGFKGKPKMIWAPALANVRTTLRLICVATYSFLLAQSPANDALIEVLTMAGPAPRQTKYVQFVWPYLPRSAAILRSRGQEVLDGEPTWS
jgi:hypothetical protein